MQFRVYCYSVIIILCKTFPSAIKKAWQAGIRFGNATPCIYILPPPYHYHKLLGSHLSSKYEKMLVCHVLFKEASHFKIL